jgi:hypothetical protein
VSLYLVYDETECPRCGNTQGNKDHGPYEPHPLDAGLGGPPPAAVHLITCGGCLKCFDVAPSRLLPGTGEEAVTRS